ncbi:MAG: hypothetical protein RR925_05595 [Erysipelotrichaceae bacterium]
MNKAILQGLTVSLLISIFGCIFIFKGATYAPQAPWLPVLLGICLLLMGVFRFLMFYKVYKNPEEK